ncbi:hypothetical protein Palpr_2099 [Paludibacter propionicigenes WB4]|uniref:LTD domain-containing protein n=1 Tax=Paludibacter propionicigenes (strain DSM 17365 / JCM 13257 / WB4) TaxID=694427 RepID=E4T691_PALPW|nr:lamin tail domain-containing protein [Paludibacter propionicigenes]ADQ80235.1 hypothetical protein Palpr_2099 [Paludibacter propionicigenes WB4]
MKNLSLFFVFFVPIFCFGQVNESFLDGNFINNPNWVGTTSNFYVNSSFQLQSKASTESTSFLFTPSEAIENATWECWVKMTTSTSGNNYAVIYLTSDKNDNTTVCNGYYVQVGGTADEVSLFVQEGTKKTKIIDGTDGRTVGNSVELQIKVTRDADGNFALYSKLASETDYVLEGTAQNKVITSSSYFGLMFVNTASTGWKYYFDDIVVSGTKAQDRQAPVWRGLSIEQPNKLKLSFSEPMDFSSAAFSVDQGMGSPTSQVYSDDKTTLELTFATDFEKGKLYTLQTTGLADLAGNVLAETSRKIGIVEPKAVGDLILNEVMFENPLNSLEYVELYNKSDKLLDVSNLVITTRKTDGTLNTGSKVPQKTWLLPHAYLALCANADSVHNYHHCSNEANILTTSSWYSLNNTGSTLVLANAAKDTIYDELAYNVRWHNTWVTNPKGISLERSGSDLPTQNQFSWHSCVSTSTNNGTPGFANSVYVDTEAPTWISINLEQPNKLELVFSEAMDVSKAVFNLDNNLGAPSSITFSDDKKSIDLTFASNFEKGKIYKLQLSGLTDLGGNALIENSRSIGIVEQKAVGDLILNEVMFENPLNSLEYVELYNKSDKLLDVSNIIITTRKTDGTLNTGSKVPLKTWLLPHAYLALCANADSVRNYHHCSAEANILSAIGSWSTLNNESSTLVLASAAKDTIYDELAYNTKWHNSWVTNPKGISLERSGFDLPTQNQFSWHSCVSISTYNGTPGFTNSVYVDTEAPVWTSFSLEQPNKLKLVFSEAMDVSKAVFSVDNNLGAPSAITLSDDKKTVDLTFTSNFDKGKIYKLQLSGLTDLGGNALIENSRSIGIVEQKAVGDLILNEVMFENPLNSLEYVELYNKSDKLLDVSNIIITTRKTDGTLNTGSKVPLKTWLLPHAYLALCANADSVRNYHHCSAEANILSAIGSWSTLNNESSTLVLASAAKDTIYDELAYNTKWHNSWVTNPKGISLERSGFDLPTQNQFSWHSCVSISTYNGTPGFTNSVYVDTEAPVWTSFSLEQPNKLKLVFSEAMDVSKVTFSVDQGINSPSTITLSDDKKTVDLTFASNFEKGKIYKLQLSGLTDLAGNALVETFRTIGIVEPKAVGDLILNEVMFENPLNSLEYVELYNKSDKLLDVSNIVVTTRKTDGTLNTGSKVPPKTWLLPHAYLALCANADSVRNYHHCPTGANILNATGSWTALNNESSTLVLASAAKDTIYDELNYNVKWHNTWVTNPKGISLERSAPNLPTQNQFSWHSSVSTATNNGTPGFSNSVYVDTEAPNWISLNLEQPNKLKLVFSEAMDVSKAAFSVDNNFGTPSSITVSDDKKTVDLTFASNFEKGKIYKLQLSGLTDLAGNALTETFRTIGIVEPKAVGDLILNEVMFENPLNSLEYIEIYNKSDKLLDVSNIVITTRKNDGTLNTGSKVPLKTWLLPHTYLALCGNADSVRNYHHCSTEANILTTSSWYSLNNTGSTLVLANAAKDTIYDELAYNVKWHNTWVTNPKGISLERSGSDLPTQNQFSWHSCVSTATNNGTPGFTNSVYVDSEAPTWTLFSLEQPNKLKLVFSEGMDVSKAVFSVDQGINAPTTITLSEDKKTVNLIFSSNFEKGKLYKLQLSVLTDLAGNALAETFRTIGIVEQKAVGELILNEVMFENPLNSLEYVELYNKSDKLLDVSNIVITTRKTDGSLNTGSKVPQKTLMLPHAYLALCANADSVRNYHHCPAEANVLTGTGSWYPLNNESSTLVLASAAKDTIYDELAYNTKWHNSWVTNPKGISLERSAPDLPTQNQFSWHSCVSTANNNGTPGFTNSVYVDTEAPVWTSFTLEQPNKLKLVFSEAMDVSKAVFTVDNNLGTPSSKTLSDDKKTVDLTFTSNFDKGKIYKLQLSGLTDLARNALAESNRSIGIVEQKGVGDLILNEVMFENPLNSLEYIEIYNKSEKLLDVSNLVVTTRKTDGTLNPGSKVPPKTWLLPHAYLALCANADSVRNYHKCLVESNILTVTGSWSALNNESSTLVLASVAKDTIYDELNYNVKWHNTWVTNPKGISLERSGSDLPTQNQFSWHSCVSASTNNGTPGFANSVYVDTEAPIWTSLNLEQPNKLKLVFSEGMDVRKATFSVDQGINTPTTISISDDKKSIDLIFTSNFEKGKIYKLQLSGLTDLAGNALMETTRSIGIVEQKAVGDLILNEVMFENPLNSLEYVELYNKSDKLLDISNLVVTTRKTDGTLNTGSKVPLKTWLLPHAYLALCANADSVKNYHHCPAEANILTVTGNWSSLNNESSTLVLASAAKDTIYDELNYNVKWHNAFVKHPKGVALERINPSLPTQSAASWHSAASEVNYGTPGYQNSQYRDISVSEVDPKIFRTDPEAFSPDNDGVNDVCFIRYKTDTTGYVANVLILNQVGMKVYQLASSILLSSEGFLTWDGRTDKGKIANSGIYVLYVEMFNPQTGAKKIIKLPIVVSTR